MHDTMPVKTPYKTCPTRIGITKSIFAAILKRFGNQPAECIDFDIEFRKKMIDIINSLWANCNLLFDDTLQSRLKAFKIDN